MNSLPLDLRATQPNRIVFDCPGALPMFDRSASGGIGGAEVRAVTFARRICQRPNVACRFVVASIQPNANQQVGQLELVFEPRRSAVQGKWADQAWRQAQKISTNLSGSLAQRIAGVPKRNLFFERLGAEVVCTFGVTNRTAGVVRSARRAGFASVVCLTSDRTLDDLSRRGRRDRGVYGELGSLCRYALRNADAIVVQKESQRQQIQHLLNRTAWLIRNPIDLEFVPTPFLADTDDALANWLASETPFVLWVGRADNFSKRADLAFEVACRCPKTRFLMVMNRDHQRLFDSLLESQPPNVRIVERVPFDQIESLYRQATLLLNTSDAEGFPNAFLQAGKYGVPTVSLTVDPDGMLMQNQIGYCGQRSLDRVIEQIERWIQKRDDYYKVSARIRSYVVENHALGDRANELWRCLESVCYPSNDHPTRLAS